MTPASNTRHDPKLAEIVEPVCRAHGVELVQVRRLNQRGGAIVRVVIDRERIATVPDGALHDGSGVTLEDCTQVSRDLSTVLDVHDDLLPGKYHLEVSSPGLERPLVRRADFERFAGRVATVHVRAPLEVGKETRRKFRGELLGMKGDAVVLSQDGTEVSIPLDDITKAHLVYEFDRERKRA